MKLDHTAAAIPVFLLFIAIELWVNRRRGDSRYRFADTLANFGCGIGSLVFGVGFKAFVFAAYVYVFEHVALWRVPATSVAGWLGLLLGVDLCYYLFHRAAHRVNILWAGHAVHHQSEEYNLSVALRQSWFIGAFSWLFYLPLVVLGYPPWMLLSVRSVVTLYQFWIHTEAIGRLGWCEYVLNTPSHHRVHHGVNAGYLNRNYGGMLIVWDRLFGTFTAETTPPVYGTSTPINSFNPLWANLVEWHRIIRLAWTSQRLGDRLRIWFMPPEWRPGIAASAAAGGGPVQRGKHECRSTRGVRLYVLLSVLMTVAGLLLYLQFQYRFSLGQHALVMTVFVFSVSAWGMLLERRRGAIEVESARLLLLSVLLLWLGSALLVPVWLLAGFVLTAVPLVIALVHLQAQLRLA